MKKQEEGEEESMEECIKRTMAANEGMTEEQARALCEQKLSQAKTVAKDKAFMDKVMAVFDEAIDLKMKDFWKRVDERMVEAIKKVEDQAVLALQKGLGIEKDPVIHLSELPEMVRKVILDTQDHGKRTETLTKDKPTEGPASAEKPPIKTAQEMFEELQKKRGANF